MTLRATERPARWWLETLRRRATQQNEELSLDGPAPFEEPKVRAAAIKFFNAAYRAEQSGIHQAHQLADEVRAWDPELAEILRLYGDEEGWHRGLLEQFLSFLGGSVQPMGRVTRFLASAHAKATRMDTIVLTNLMFETIGSTTYRMTLRHAKHPSVRQMLTILTRDESFHVPLNVYFLKRVLERSSALHKLRLQLLHRVVFCALVALPIASRPKSKAFDQLTTLELARAYARELAALFVAQPEIPLSPPWALLRLLGVRRTDLRAVHATSEASALAAADRHSVQVHAL